MERVLEEALKGFVSDVLSTDRPCSELSLKIFCIFKTIIGTDNNLQEAEIFSLVKPHITSFPAVKEELVQCDSPTKCLQILRSQILIRLFFVWVARDCLSKDVDNDPELRNVVDEVIKLCEMFCIRTDPLQLNAFLSDTAMRMYLDYVPDILACIFDEFLLPIPKELAAVAGSGQDGSPMAVRSPQDKELSSDYGPEWSKPSGRSQRSGRPFLSPIKNVDASSSAGRPANRFGKRPSRQILVAARSSAVGAVEVNQKKRGGHLKHISLPVGTKSSDRRIAARSQSFDHVGAALRQRSVLQPSAPVAASISEADKRGSQTGSVRRCLFSDPLPPMPSTQAAARCGYTTPRKRSAAAITSIADTPPMDKKQLRVAPMTPLSKMDGSPTFSKPGIPPLTSSNSFRTVTTPLRRLQQSIGSPQPGAVLVPQSPDDSKAGIAARSFYTKTSLPQSVAALLPKKKSVLGDNNRRTMSSYDLSGSVMQSNDTTHFLFAELMTMSPTTGVTESSVIYGGKTASFGFFPPAELDSPRSCRAAPAFSQSSQSCLLGSPVIESRSSRRTLQQSQLASPFSVAAGYTCE